MSTSGTDQLISIAADGSFTADLIGAKAASLQRLTTHGLRVPPALVLSTAFFQPWFDLLRRMPSWTAWRDGQRAQWPALCIDIKTAAQALPLSNGQQGTLALLAQRLAPHGPARRFAVRSSAPDEDMAGMSFAGLYETELGVTPAGMEDAIRRCFAACLDYRVLAYKAEHGMAPDRLAMALIVQILLDSEVAGVGFSINPLTNDYDEAVIDANWGLGESVVAGVATPDHFVIDKLSGAVISRQLGAKQVSVAVSAVSGTVSAPHPMRGHYCLSEAQLCEINATICRLESFYGHPVDMEWAYANGELFVLQARAVTRYVPLPPEMMTPPGARRALYMDIALSKGMTSNEAISPIGLDWLKGDMSHMLRHCLGKATLDVTSPHGLIYLGGGRMYMNLSNLLWFSSPAQLAKGNAATDRLMADVLSGIDATRYRAEQRPAWIWPALRVLPVALWRLRRAIWRVLRSILAPASTHRLYLQEKQGFEVRYAGLVDNDIPLEQFQARYGAPSIAHIVDVDMPALAVGALAALIAQRLPGKRDTEAQALAEQLSRGIEGNLVVDMGVRIFRMAKMLDPAAFNDIGALLARIERRELPGTFLQSWDAFMASYGCRGPGEMDLANQHYADDPALVLRQMSFVTSSGADLDPELSHRSLAHQRQRALLALLPRFGWLRRALLRRACTMMDLFGGTRDTPKLHNLMYQHAARKRLLWEGAKLHAAGRLDRREQVFDLTVPDVLAACSDAALDLRALARQRTSFSGTLKTHVRNFPAVIDSRGRIQRPPHRDERPGEVSGMAVSPGIVIGRIKRLHNAHEKPIEKGDILVAFTTDPGWTPLFINAAAVILEVGGVLQHGAVVAREYGKPCVAGIADVLSRFADGQLVEVDGGAGTVRVIAEPGDAGRDAIARN